MKKMFNSKSKVAFILGLAVMNLSNTVFAADTKTEVKADTSLLNEILGLVEKFAIMGGGLWAVWGVIVLAGGLKDKNGPALQSGIWQTIGGGLIIAAAAIFKNIVK